MSHQTGIKANEELKKFFGKCRDGKTRAFKVSIESEQLALKAVKPIIRNWEEDFDRIVPYLIEDNEPCYILYRLDSRHSSGFQWLFISWCPDSAPVRQKMLYGATKSTLKQEFGTGDIEDEFHVVTKDEVNLRGYKEHKRDLSAPAPLTYREEELKELKRGELAGVNQIGIDTKHQTLGNVAVPVDERAIKALHDLKAKRINYIQLKIDVEKEHILLAEESKIKATELKSRIPKDGARYHLFNYRHSYEGDITETIVFIYSMPGFSVSIKERMLYSSCKANLINGLTDMGLDIEKKLEVDADEDVTEEFLFDEVHPKVNLHRPKFDKPKGPPNRGARRITKSQN